MSRPGPARRMAVAALAAAAGLAIAAPLLGQMHGSTTPGPARAVAITDLGVTPTTVVVAPGQRLEWLNTGRNRHTVTADDGTFDSGILAPGERFALTAAQTTGRIPYHCSIHAFIRGTLVVSAVDLEGPAIVPVGAAAPLSGAAPEAGAGVAVVIEARRPGAWEPVAQALTGPDGAFSARVPGLTSRTALRARIGEDVSPALRIGVRPRVVARRRGSDLEVAVAPAAPGARLVLERLDLDTYRWIAVRTARLGTGGRARLRTPAPGVWRVRVPRAAPGLAEAASTGVAVPMRTGRSPGGARTP